MKKFIIFFLMVFLYLGNCQARSGSTEAKADVGKTYSVWELLSDANVAEHRIAQLFAAMQAEQSSAYPGTISGTFRDTAGSSNPAYSPFNIAINGIQHPPLLTVDFTTSMGIDSIVWVMAGTTGESIVASATRSYQVPNNLPTGTYEIYVARRLPGINNLQRVSESFIVNKLSNFIVNITGTEVACLGEYVTMTAIVDGANADYKYQWLMDGQYLPGEIDQVLRFTTDSINGRHDFAVMVTADGCDAELSGVIRFNTVDSTRILVRASSNVVCSGGDFTLTALIGSCDNCNYQFRWYKVNGPDGVIDQNSTYVGMGEFITITAPDVTSGEETFYYTAKVTNSSGCDVTTEVVAITVIPNMNVYIRDGSLGEGSSAYCVGNTIHLVAYVEGIDQSADITYTWYENNVIIEGANRSNLHRLHDLIDNTVNVYIYRVVVSVNGTNCSAASFTHEVNILPTPVLEIYGNNEYCVGDQVELRAVGYPALLDNGAYYMWFLDNRELYHHNGSTIDTLFSQPGEYVFKARRYNGATGARICETNTENFIVTVRDHLVVEATATFDSVCLNSEVLLTANLGDYNVENLTYRWYKDAIGTGNEIDGATSRMYNALINTVGDHKFFVEVISTSSGCVGIDSVTVKGVDGNIFQVKIAAQNNLCSGGSLELEATFPDLTNDEGYGNEIFQWYVNGVEIPGATQRIITHNPVLMGLVEETFYYTVIVNRPGVDCAVSVTTTDGVTIVPSPSVVITGDNMVCAANRGDNIELTANIINDGGDYTYTWYEDGVNLDDEIGSVLSLQRAPRQTPYIYMVKVIDEEMGCFATATYYVMVNEGIGVVATVDNGIVCEGGEVTLTATLAQWSEEGVNYQWYQGGTMIPGATAPTYTTNMENSGTYNYSVAISQPNTQCTGRSREVRVFVNARPIVTLESNVDAICDGGAVILTSTLSNLTNGARDISADAVYTWYRNDQIVEGADRDRLIDYPTAPDGDAAPFTYIVKAEYDLPGCTTTSSNEVIVTINGNPEVSINGPQYICDNEDLILTPNIPNWNGNIGDDDYRWEMLYSGESMHSTVWVPVDPTAYLNGFNSALPIGINREMQTQFNDRYVKQHEFAPLTPDMMTNELPSCLICLTIPLIDVETELPVIGEINVDLSFCLVRGPSTKEIYEMGYNTPLPVDALGQITGAVEGLIDVHSAWYTELRTQVREAAEIVALEDAATVGALIDQNKGIEMGAQRGEEVIESLIDDILNNATYTTNLLLPLNLIDTILPDGLFDNVPTWLTGNCSREGMAETVEASILSVLGAFGYPSGNPIVDGPIENILNIGIPAILDGLNSETGREVIASAVEGMLNTLNETIYQAAGIQIPAEIIASMTNSITDFIAGNLFSTAPYGLTDLAQAYTDGVRMSYWDTFDETFQTIFKRSLIHHVNETYTHAYNRTFTENYSEQITEVQNNPTLEIPADSIDASVNPYVFVLRVEGENGCIATSEPFTVMIQPTPVAELTADYYEICEGGEVNLTANLVDANTENLIYRWFLNDTTNPIHGATSANYTTTLTEAGDYYFIMQVIQTNSSCGFISDSLLITVNPKPVIEIASNVNAICDGGAVILTATNNVSDDISASTLDNSIYTWYRNGQVINGAVLSQIVDFPFAPDGDVNTFTYSAVATSNIPGCTSELSNTVEVALNPNPTLYVDGEPVICEGMPVELMVNVDDYDPATGTLTYEWNMIGEMFDGLIEYEYDTMKTEQYLSQYNTLFGLRLGNNLITSFNNNYEQQFDVKDSTYSTDPFAAWHSFALRGVTIWNECLTGAYEFERWCIPFTSFCVGPYTLGGAASMSTMYSQGATLADDQNPATAGANAATPKATGLVTDILAQLGAVATADATTDATYFSTNQIPVAQGEANTTAVANAENLVNTLLTEVIAAATYDYEYITSVEPTFGDYVNKEASNGGNGCGVAGDLDKQINAFRHGYNYQFWSQFDAAFKAEFVAILTARVPEMSAAYVNAYTATFADLYEVIFAYPYGVRNDTALFVMGQLSARTRPYQFLVTVSNGNGCNTTSEIFDVLINPAPIVEVTTTQDTICMGTEITLTANLGDYNADALTYRWFLNDTLTPIYGATERTLTITPEVLGDNKYIAKVYQTNSTCVSYDEIDIFVMPNEIFVTVEATPETICQGAQVVAVATVTDPIGNEVYTWYRNGVIVENATQSTLFDTPVDGNLTYTYVYGVVVSRPGTTCTSAMAYDTVYVQPTPTVAISGDPIICEGNNIVLTANINDDYDGSTLTYDWRLNNTSVGDNTATLSIERPTSDNPYIFTLVVSNEVGCVATSDPFYVYVNSNPVVEVTVDQDTVCAGMEVTFTAHLGDYNSPNLVYRWFHEGVQVHGATERTYTTILNETGNQVYEVRVTQTTSACTATGKDSVEVIGSTILVSVEATPETICQGAQVVAVATVTDPIGNEVYTWYRNGVIVENATQSTLFDTPVDGNLTYTYVYGVVVSRPGTTCVSAMAYDTVYVQPTPTVAISGDPIICEGTNIVLTANINDNYEGSALTYDWRLDNTTVGSTATLSIERPTSDNPYIFTLVVSNEVGCVATSDPFYVYVNSNPVVEVTVDQDTVCAGMEVTFTAHLGDYNSPNLVYRWFHEGAQVHGATERTFTTVLNETGNQVYEVRVAQTTSACTATGKDSVEVIGSTIHVALNATPETICEGAQVTAVATVTNPMGNEVYTWYRNGVIVENATQSTIYDTPVSGNEEYTYVYGVVVSRPGTTCTSAMAYDTVYTIPAPTVEIAGTPIVCTSEDNNITLTANVLPVGEYTYTWYENNEAITDGDNAQLTLTKGYSEFPYNFSVKVEGNNGCEAYATYSVMVNNNITVHIAANHTDICVGGEVTLAAQLFNMNADNLVYQWYNADGPIAGANALTYTTTLSENTTFHFTVNQLDSECEGTSNEVTVTVESTPTITISSGDVTAICDGGAVILTADPNDASASYVWYRNGQVIEGAALGQIIDFPFAPDGDQNVFTYKATVSYDRPACQSTYSNAVAITVNPNPTVYVEGAPIVCEGQEANLHANILGYDTATGSLTTTWYLLGSEFEHGTNITRHSAGDYLLGLGNVFGIKNINALNVAFDTDYIPAHGIDPANYSDDNLISGYSGGILGCRDRSYNATSLAGMYELGREASIPGNWPSYSDNANQAALDAAQAYFNANRDAIVTYAQNTGATDGGAETNLVTYINGQTDAEQVAEAFVADQIDDILSFARYDAYLNILSEVLPYTEVPSTADYTQAYWGPCNFYNLSDRINQTSAYREGLRLNYYSKIDNAFQTAYINQLTTLIYESFITTYADAYLAEYDVLTNVLANGAATSTLMVDTLPARNYPYHIIAIVNGENGCTTVSDIFELTVKSAPVVEVTTTHDTICLGTEITLTGNLGNYNESGLNYRWYENNMETPIYGATERTLTLVPEELGDITYILEVIDMASECVSTDQFTVHVKVSDIIVELVADKDTICGGSPVTFQAILDRPITNEVFTWYNNGAIVQDAIQSTYTIEIPESNVPVTYIYGVKVYRPESNCESAILYDTVVVYPNPIVTIAGEPVICTDRNVELTANVRNSYETANLSYQWYLDSDPVGENNATLIYDAEFSVHPYLFTVVVENEDGCRAEDSFEVYVNDTIRVAVTADYTTVCEGAEVTFTGHLEDYNVNRLSYQWYVNGDAVPYGTEITFTTPVHRNDEIKLVVTDMDGGCGMTGIAPEMNFININGDIVAINLSSNSHSVCDGAQVHVTAYVIDDEGRSYIDTTVRYRWERNGFWMPLVTGPHFSESLMTVDGDSTQFVYSVTLDIPGCDAYNFHGSDTIMVRRNPIVVIDGDHEVCENGIDGTGTVRLTAWTDGRATMRTSIKWYVNGQLRSSGNNQYLYNENWESNTDPYVFTVEVANGNGCSAFSEPFEVMVHAKTGLNITATEEVICEDGEITLRANLDNYNENYITYQWYKNEYNEDFKIPGATRIEHTTIVEETTRFIALVRQTSTGCQELDTMLITVNNRPVIEEIIVDVNDEICEGRQVNMTAVVTGGVTGGEIFTWYRNGEVIEGATLATYTESPVTIDNDITTYTYNVEVVQAASGCIDSLHAENAVVVVVKPNPTVVISGDPIICHLYENNISLTANVFPAAADGEYTYQWFEDNAPIEGATDPTYMTTKSFRTHSYNFHVEVYNEYGCTTISDVFNAYVNDQPVVNITATETDICENGQVTLQAHLNNWNANMLTLQWYADDVAIDGATSLTYTTTLTETTIFSLKVDQLTSGCHAESNEIAVNVTSIPVISSIDVSRTFYGEVDEICEGGQVTLTANVRGGVTGGEIFTWYKNGTIIEGATLATIVDSPVTVDGDPTDYTYKVTVKQTASGCESVLTSRSQETITVYPNPVVVIAGDPIICEVNEGRNIVLEANVTPVHATTTYRYSYTWYEDNERITDNMTAVTSTLRVNRPDRDHPYNFTVEVGNNWGCTVRSDVFHVYVNERPQIVVTTTEDQICEGGTVTLSANLHDWNGETMQYQWFADGDAIPGATSLTYTTTLDETTTFYFRAFQYNSGCEGISAEVTITVVPDPVITDIAISTIPSGDEIDEICEGGQFSLTAIVEGGVTGGEIFTWYRNGQIIEGATLATIVESPVTVDGDPTDYTYQVTVRQTASGCESILTDDSQATITVYPTPVVVIAGDPIICEVNEDVNIVLNANVTPEREITDTYTYTWYEDNERIVENASASTPTLSVNRPDRDHPYNFTVEVGNNWGCTVRSDVFHVYVNERPQIVVTTTEDQICEGGTVTLSANLHDWNGETMQYQWFADGDAIPGATSLTYTTTLDETTTFYFRAFQYNSGCEGISAEVTITVVPDPIITDIAISTIPSGDEIDEICEGGQFSLTAVVEGGVTGGEIFTWYRNGQIIEGATLATIVESPVTVDGDPTDYTYQVTVRQTASGCESILTDESQATITVYPNPVVVIAGDPIICEVNEDMNIVLNANVTPEREITDTYTYTWYEDNERIVENASASTPTLSVNRPDRDHSYNFTVEVANNWGCTVRSEVFQVFVNEKPQVVATTTEDMICEGGVVTLSAHLHDWNGETMQYQWFEGTYPNGQAIPGATSLTYTTTLNETTTFYFRAFQYNSECEGISDGVTIIVVPDPVISHVTISETQICDGGIVTLTAHIDDEKPGVVGSPYTYTWFRNGFVIEGATSATFTESPATVDGDYTSYEYSVYVTQNASGCESETVVAPMLNVYANPRVMISGDHHICETDTVSLIANVDTTSNPVGTLSYTWYEHGQIRDNMASGFGDSQFFTEYFYANENPYVFTVEVTRENGCTTMSPEFHLYVHPRPVVNITANETDICVGGEVTLTANLNDYNQEFITFQWFNVTTEEVEVAYGFDENGGYMYRTEEREVITDIPGATFIFHTTTLQESANIGVRVVQTISDCEATDVIGINVHDLPVVTSIEIEEGTTPMCDGGQLTLRAIVEGGVTGGEVFTWYRNDVIIPGANQVTYTESPLTVDYNVTTYTYNVVVSQSADGCTSVLDEEVAVDIVMYPNPTVMISGDPIVCQETENNISLTANVYPEAVSGTYGYQWFENNVLIEDATAPTYVTSKLYSTDPYNFHVRISNEYGCSIDSEVYPVYVNATPMVYISATETDICEGGEITLIADMNDWNNDMLTYQWFADGEAIGGATSLTYTTTLTETTVFTFEVLQLTSGCHAVSAAPLTINVNPIPVVVIVDVVNDAICTGGQVTLTATAPNTYPAEFGQATYTWYRNGSVVAGATQHILSESPTAVDEDETTFTYMVEVSFEAAGCASNISGATTVVVSPTQTVQIAANSSTTYCDGGEVTLSANVSPVEDYTYAWYRDNVLVGNEATYTSRDAARETVYNYHVIVTHNAGCIVTSETLPITVVGQPIVSVTLDNNTICEGGVATFAANVQGGVNDVNGLGQYTYAWYNNLSDEVLGTNATYTTLPTDAIGTYVYYVNVTSPYGCEVRTYSPNLTIVADPTVTIAVATGYDETICDGGSTMLIANVTGGFGENHYQWFKNGIRLEGETNGTLSTGVLHYNSTAAYTVQVTQDGVDCSAVSEQYNVTVVPAHQITITGNTNVCVGGTVTMTAQLVDNLLPGEVLSYQWYRIFNGNATAIQGANSVEYTTSELQLGDTYEYYVVATSSISGCDVSSGSVIANVVADPTVQLTAPASICENSDLVLNAFVYNGVAGVDYTYTWTVRLSGVETIHTTNEPTLTLSSLDATNASNPYYFTVTINRTDNTGCDATSNQVAVSVVSVPVVVVTMDNPEICEGGQITFTANVNPVGVYNYEWYVNGVIRGYSQTLTIGNLPVGTTNTVYAVAIPVGADDVCSSRSADVNPVVIANPVVNAITADVTSMCVGGTVNVSIATVNGAPFTGSNDYSYQWSVNGFEVAGAIQSTFSQTLSTAGTYRYNVRISLNNGLGCSSVWSNNPVDVTVVPQPEITIAPAAHGLIDICEGGEVNLTSTIANNSAVYGNVTYTWYASGIPTGIATANLTQTLDTVGAYIYKVVANFDGIACNIATSNEITVNVNAAPSWTTVQAITPNADGNICEGERVELIAAIQGGVQDATGNTSGIIQWYVQAEGGNEVPVSGGLGAVTHDYPSGYGNFNYIVRYSDQLGASSGCAIDAGAPTPNTNGFTVTVHQLPTAHFSAGEGSTICANNHNDAATLEISFEGTAPFSFVLQNTTTGQLTSYANIYQNPYTIYVRPDMTSTYTVFNLNDAYCSAAGDPITGVTTITVTVSNVDVPSAFTLDCEAEITTDGSPMVSMPITILSGYPSSFNVVFEDDNLSLYNVYGAEITQNAQGYFLEFPITANPGTYGLTVVIDGCSYYVSVTVPVLGNNWNGVQVMDVRWDETVVVNNNPAENGGYEFLTYQWYKNGDLIPGATLQYYQDLTGLNGFYSVVLTYKDPITGHIIEITTCAISFLNDNTMKVYPVPAEANQRITIETSMSSEELQGAVLDIFDAKGAHIQRITSVQPITIIEGFKAQGTYFGRIITSDSQIKTVKFVIAK